MIDYILAFQWNGLLGILLYWIPLAFCTVFYTVRTAQNYMKDKAKQELDPKFYHPTDTVGTLIGRAIIAVVPVANLWAAMFDLSPKVFSKLFIYLEKIFSQPLVPRK